MRPTHLTALALPLALVLAAGCGKQEPPVVEDDAGVEAPDAGEDAGLPDAGKPDAGKPDAGPTDAGFETVPPDQWCHAAAVGYCHRAQRCLLVTDAEWEDCIGRRLAACAEDDIQAGIASGRIVYDATAAAACANGYAHVGCHLEPADCATVFQGQVATGGTCLMASECQPGSYCQGAGYTCPSLCRAYRPLGETCNFGDQMCDPAEARCTVVAGQNRCVARKELGEACVFYDECRQDLQCLESKCIPREAMAGESCREVYNYYPNCTPDHFCRQGPAPPGGEPPPGICVKRVGLGGACSSWDNCLTGLRCSSIYATGTCILLGGEGDTCNGYNDCRTELHCSSSTSRCVKLPAQDGNCGSTAGYPGCAFGYYCDYPGYTCLPLRAVGEPCDYDWSCASNQCRGWTCAAACSVRLDGGS